MTALRSAAPAALFALALAPSVARAQQQQSTVRITDRIARNHFENGSEYFRLGRYTDAAREFEHAFETSHQNELLYNVAWSYELGGDLPNALQWYQRFEQAGAPGFGLEPLHQRMANLRNRMPSTEPNASASPPPHDTASAPPTAIEPVQNPPARASHNVYRQSMLNTVGPFVAIGIGAVFGGLAVWQGVSFASDRSAVNDANAGQLLWSADLTGRYNRIAGEGTLAWVFGGIGVAAIAAGVVWIVARGPGERIEVTSSRRVGATPFAAVAPGGAIAGFGGAF